MATKIYCDVCNTEMPEDRYKVHCLTFQGKRTTIYINGVEDSCSKCHRKIMAILKTVSEQADATIEQFFKKG